MKPALPHRHGLLLFLGYGTLALSHEGDGRSRLTDRAQRADILRVTVARVMLASESAKQTAGNLSPTALQRVLGIPELGIGV